MRERKKTKGKKSGDAGPVVQLTCKFSLDRYNTHTVKNDVIDIKIVSY